MADSMFIRFMVKMATSHNGDRSKRRHQNGNRWKRRKSKRATNPIMSVNVSVWTSCVTIVVHIRTRNFWSADRAHVGQQRNSRCPGWDTGTVLSTVMQVHIHAYTVHPLIACSRYTGHNQFYKTHFSTLKKLFSVAPLFLAPMTCTFVTLHKGVLCSLLLRTERCLSPFWICCCRLFDRVPIHTTADFVISPLFLLYICHWSY